MHNFIIMLLVFSLFSGAVKNTSHMDFGNQEYIKITDIDYYDSYGNESNENHKQENHSEECDHCCCNMHQLVFLSQQQKNTISVFQQAISLRRDTNISFDHLDIERPPRLNAVVHIG